MRFWTAYAILALSLTKAYASGGGGHHASITDLLAPTINVAILIGVLVWKSESDVSHFEKTLSKETEDKAQKLKTDANSKIQADKKALMDDLNAELLNQVIKKTKSTIKTNKDYQDKVSTKLLQGL